MNKKQLQKLIAAVFSVALLSSPGYAAKAVPKEAQQKSETKPSTKSKKPKKQKAPSTGAPACHATPEKPIF